MYLKKFYLYVTMVSRGENRWKMNRKKNYGKVAQLVRAHGSYPWGREFESLPCYFLLPWYDWISVYFFVRFARKCFSSLRGQKPEAIQFLPTLNGRKFSNSNWTKTDFWWTLFSIFIYPSPELRPSSPHKGRG